MYFYCIQVSQTSDVRVAATELLPNDDITQGITDIRVGQDIAHPNTRNSTQVPTEFQREIRIENGKVVLNEREPFRRQETREREPLRRPPSRAEVPRIVTPEPIRPINDNMPMEYEEPGINPADVMPSYANLACTDPTDKWYAELNLLGEMGFDDPRRNRVTLEKYDGKMDAVVNYLLENFPTEQTRIFFENNERPLPESRGYERNFNRPNQNQAYGNNRPMSPYNGQQQRPMSAGGYGYGAPGQSHRSPPSPFANNASLGRQPSPNVQ